MLRLLASQKRTADFAHSDIGKIVVVELTRLGDVMVILPFLNRLHRQFSSSHIRVLVNEDYLPLLHALESESEFVGVSRPGGVSGLAAAVRRVRSGPVDLVISASPPRRNALVALASDARLKVGYLSHLDSLTPFLESTPVESFGFALRSRAVFSRENISERPAKILSGLGISPALSGWHTALRPEISASVKARMMEEGRVPQRRYVLLHPFSGWEYRSWPLEDFLMLAARIQVQFGFDAVMSVEPGSIPKLHEALGQQSPPSVILSSGLLEMAVLMTGAELVVGNDSGPLHLAVLLGKRVVGLFGPAPPGLTAPRGEGDGYLYKRVECSPCDQRRCVRPDHPCMTELGVDEVFDVASRLLRSPAAQPSLTTNAQG